MDGGRRGGASKRRQGQLLQGPPSPPAHAAPRAPPHPSRDPFSSPRCSRILVPSASTPTRAASCAHLHTDLQRPGRACASSGSPKPARPSPAARAARGAGSARATGPDLGAAGGGRVGCCPRRRPAGHVSAASPEPGFPPPRPLTYIPQGPDSCGRAGGVCGKGVVTNRAGRGRLPDCTCFTWRNSGSRSASI